MCALLKIEPASQTDVPLTLSSKRLADLAVSALLEELRLYPKPGLVSPVDTGSHRDMDFALMAKSACCLHGYFFDVAEVGRAGVGFFDGLVPLGLEAEKYMLESTAGINTHRGAIFVLGLLVAATARCPEPVTPQGIRDTLLHTWGKALWDHLSKGILADSHGGSTHRRTGHGGAREEAALGFPGLFKYALPAFRQLLAGGIPEDVAAVGTLFHLITQIHDSNLVYRGGLSGAAYARQAAQEFLDSGGVARTDWQAHAVEIHLQFVSKRLSPGGAADLLAATLFLHKVSFEHAPHD